MTTQRSLRQSAQKRSGRGSVPTPTQDWKDQVQIRLSEQRRQDRERQQEKLRALYKEQEDAMMAMVYGPDWKTRDDIPL